LVRQVALTDTIICPSEGMLNNLVDEGIPKSKLALVRTPVRMKRHDPDADRQPEVVYFGRFGPEKNITLLIDAFADFVRQHPGWKLRLIGDGPERANLQDGIESVGLSDKVEMLPFLEQNVLFERIARSRIMVMMSSVLENWPLVIPEAVMCGLYPVVPAHGGMKEAIEWLGAGTSYRSGDRSSLTEALGSAIKADSAAIESARDRIEDELAPERYVTEVIRLYRSLIES
ncbi:MAG: glycosyltransferase family 4 protein, partial [Pseudomonadales bacterium]|nr:glycosyltransferase family 4 protein [Pseudomonadales bacterium]